MKPPSLSPQSLRKMIAHVFQAGQDKQVARSRIRADGQSGVALAAPHGQDIR
jgi:hypothetical protein